MMTDPGQHRSARPLLIKQFRYIAAVLLSTVLLCLGTATARAEESIIIDFVRHGESAANAAGVLDTAPPGTSLDSTGVLQAKAVADAIQAEYGNNIGIYASQEIRAQETASVLAQTVGMDVHQPYLSGLNEIPAGIFNGSPELSVGGLLYYLAPVSWVLGFPLVPDLGDPSVNGVTFDESFGGAVQTIFDNTGGNPTDVAFSSEGAMAVWTLMNVNNPDFSVVLQQLLTTGQLLPNGGQVVVEGAPGDWTLLSYDGMPVPQDPGLPTDLFVDFRNLIEAPQFAAYDIWQALLTGDPTTIVTAIRDGVGEVGTATVNFPLAVTQQLVDAVGGSGLGGLSTDLTNLLPTTATDLPAALSGELGTILGIGLGGLSTDLTNLLPTTATDLPAALSGQLGTILIDALMSL